MKNLFYFKKISAIGGTEQFLYEIAKKYKDLDITICYDEADFEQLKRLSKFVRCKKHIKGKTIECDRAFFNFNIDAIDDIISTENYYAFVSHANWEEIGYKPPINHPKLNHFIGVSKFATKKLDEYAKSLGMNIKAKKCYNPLTLEPKEKVLIFVSAARLDDVVKGGKRIQTMIEEADRYCEETGLHYLWLIFSNPNIKAKIKSKNVAIMPPRVDVRPYIAMADYIIHLPNDMETYCYTDNEAFGYGVPVVTTPLSILKELPADDNMTIVCNYDMSNVKEVVKEIFEKKVKPFKYEIPEDDWDKILAKGESTYQKDLKTKVKIKAIRNYFDIEKNKTIKIDDEPFEVSKVRAEYLTELELVEIIK